MHRGRLLLAALFAVILSACGNNPVPETPVGPTPTQGASDVTSIPATITPTPFKTEMVICTDTEPAALLGGSDSDALRQLVLPSAVSYGADYLADPTLLSALPDESNGTLRRNDDGTVTVTLQYREGLAWSDGTPFTADDALLGLMNPPRPSDPIFEVIEAEKIDDLTIEVIAASDVEYPYVPSQPPLPSHVLTAENAAQIGTLDYARLINPALGPYLLSEWVPGSHMLFAANPHHSPLPRLGSVRVRFIPDPNQIVVELQNGGCDVALDDALTLTQFGSLGTSAVLMQPYTAASAIYEQVIFNAAPETGTTTPYFADPLVRQAFAQAIDRATLAQTVTLGITPVMDSWLSADHWGYSPASQPAFDSGAAISLLTQAGWTDQDGDRIREYHGTGGTYTCQRGDWTIPEGTPLRPTLLTTDDPLRDPIIEKLRADLLAIGADLDVQRLPAETLFSAEGQIARRLFDLALFSGITRPDPAGINRFVGADVYRHPLDRTLVHRWQLEDRWLTTEQLAERLAFSNIPSEANRWQGQNYGGWCNEQADLDIVAASQPLTLAERQPFLAAHQSAVAADVPILPLFARPRIAASAPYVCGIDLGPYDVLTWNIASWSFDPSGSCSE